MIDTAKDFVKELLVGNHVEEPDGLGCVGGRKCFGWLVGIMFKSATIIPLNH